MEKKLKTIRKFRNFPDHHQPTNTTSHEFEHPTNPQTTYHPLRDLFKLGWFEPHPLGNPQCSHIGGQ